PSRFRISKTFWRLPGARTPRVSGSRRTATLSSSRFAALATCTPCQLLTRPRPASCVSLFLRVSRLRMSPRLAR
ncbi:hypothetical protein LPJ69_006583, partial [Coemansia sp. RSA 1752]